MPGIKPIPASKLGLSSVNLAVPENGSVPTVARIRPPTPEMAPLIRSFPAKLLISTIPNTPRAKYSGGPNARANFDSGTASPTRTQTPMSPPVVLAIKEIPSARPLSPRRCNS